MKQLTIRNPQKLKALLSTKELIYLAMQHKYTLAQQKLLQQLLTEHKKAGFICHVSYLIAADIEE